MLNRRPKNGYSLMELLVVLSLLSLITAIAMPNLVNLSRSFSGALELESIVRQINGLGFKAYKNEQRFLLEDQSYEINSPSLAITLPEGWRIDVDRPLTYAANGVCAGGTLKILYEDILRKNIRLEAPYCQISL